MSHSARENHRIILEMSCLNAAAKERSGQSHCAGATSSMVGFTMSDVCAHRQNGGSTNRPAWKLAFHLAPTLIFRFLYAGLSCAYACGTVNGMLVIACRNCLPHERQKTPLILWRTPPIAVSCCSAGLLHHSQVLPIGAESLATRRLNSFFFMNILLRVLLSMHPTCQKFLS